MTNQSGGAVSGAAGGILGGTYPSPSFASNGTTPLLGTLTALLGANIAALALGVWTDVAAVAITPGTWLVVAQAVLSGSAASHGLSVRVYDGTTTFASTDSNAPVAGYRFTVPITTLAVITGNTTLHLQANSASGGDTVYAASASVPVGNNASQLVAMRIA